MPLGIGIWRYLVLPGVGLVLGLLVARYGGEKGWLAGRVRAYTPGRGVAVLFLLGVVAFGGLTLARYLTWHSFVHDLGSYDQKVWMASLQTDWWEMLRQTWRGGIEVSPCGRVREWGVCHFQPLHVIPALLYRLWASPILLLVIEVLTVMSGLIPLHRLATRRLGDPQLAVGVCVLYLLFPAVQFNALLDFRPDFVVIPLLLWGFLLADQGRFVPALVVVGAAGLMKETLILTWGMFGLYLWLRHGRRRLGVAVFAVSLIAFYLVTFWLLSGPSASEGGFLLDKYFHTMGPSLLLRRDKLLYLAALFGPLASLPLLSPVSLLPALPTLGISLLSSDVSHASIHSQYSSSSIAPIFVALLDVMGRPSPGRISWLTPTRLVRGLVVLSLFVTVAIGPTPLSVNFWRQSWGGHWHYTQYVPDRQATLDRAARLIPSDPHIPVLSQNDLNSAHLAHRYAYFAFPNQLPRADYVLLDTRRLPFVYWTPEPDRYRALVEELRGSDRWRIVFDEDGVLLFRRAQP